MKQFAKAEQTRREFLGGVLAGGAATALLAVGAVDANKQALAADSPQVEQKPEGYRLTPHIETYYQKAQI